MITIREIRVREPSVLLADMRMSVRGGGEVQKYGKPRGDDGKLERVGKVVKDVIDDVEISHLSNNVHRGIYD